MYRLFPESLVFTAVGVPGPARTERFRSGCIRSWKKSFRDLTGM